MNTTDPMQKAQDWQSNAQAAGQDLGSRFQEKARALQQTAQEWQRRASESTRRAAQATDVYVRENPWSVITCVALGFFALGLLVGRSRD